MDRDPDRGTPTPGTTRLLLIVVGLAVVGVAFWLLFRLFAPLSAPPTSTEDETPEALHEAYRLLTEGHYHEAYQQYTELSKLSDNTSDNTPASQEAIIALHLGILHALRGEHIQAEVLIRRALWLGLEDEETHERALFYLAHSLRQQGLFDDAQQAWAAARSDSPYQGAERLLAGETELQRGNIPQATAAYTEAQAFALPRDWVPLLIYRLSLIEAAANPERARERLNALATGEGADTLLRVSPIAPDPLLSPLVPDVSQQIGRLMAILERPDPERHQLLGQFLLDQGYNKLAAQQFSQVPASSDTGLRSAAYAAYARWRAGEVREGVQQLETLVAQHPDEPRPRLLLVLVYLAQNDSDAAHNQLEQLSERHPEMAEVQVTWANWYVLQSDYAGATSAYQQALALASDDERGQYAIITARFHLDTSYNLCDQGRPAADLAVRAAPADPNAWVTLAACAYRCNDMAGAEVAASNALDLGAGVEATFYMGASLIEQGKYEEGRAYLIRAANLSPDSVWRERAEEQLQRVW